MKNVFSVLLVSIMSLFSSCTKDRITGSGTIKSEDRFIKNFTQVSMAGSTDVTVVKGAVFNVNVKGYSNLLPYFETNVVNGTLELGFDEHVRVIHSNIEVIVTVPVLNGLSMAGSGNIRSAGDFTGNNNFRVEIAGSGNINIEDGDALNFSASIF